MESIKINCLIGDTVYKICPKCNDYHNGNCKNCAWGGCCGPCTIDPYIYSDGSYNKNKKQVVERRVYENNFVHVNEWWNIGYFPTKEECEIAIKEYESICAIKDKKLRVIEYNKWVRSRDTGVKLSR